jgi:hypothetical protein
MPAADVPSSGKGLLSLLRKAPTTTGLLALLLAALMHRPLLQTALGQTLRVAAARQGLNFSARLSGNMLTQCVLEDLVLGARPDSRSPFERLQVRKASLHYNPARMLFSATDRGLTALMVSGAELRLKHREKSASGTFSLQQALSKWSGMLLNFPLLRTQSLQLSNIDIVSGTGETGLAIRGASLSAQRGEEGVMEVESLRLTAGAEPVALKATTTLESGKFALGGLKLGSALALKRVQIEVSNSGKSTALMDVEGVYGGGPLFVRVEAGRMLWRLHAETGRINAESLREWIGATADSLPDVVTARVDVAGNPKQIDSWKGEVRLECARKLKSGSTASIACLGMLQDGVLSLSSLAGESPDSRLSGSGKVMLPESTAPFAGLEAGAEIDFESRNIAEWDQRVPPGRISGKVKGSVQLKISNGVAQMEIHTRGEEILAGVLGAKQCRVDASVSAPLGALGSVENFAGNAVVSLKQPRYAGATLQAAFEEGAFAVNLDDGKARFWNIVLKDSVNALAGELLVPLSAGGLSPSGSVRLQAGDLSAAGVQYEGHAFSGSLAAEWSGTLETGGMIGQLNVSGKSLSWGAFTLEKLRATASVKDGLIDLNEGGLEWSESEWIRASGKVDLPPRDGSLLQVEARLPNLGRVSPLLEQLGVAKSRVSGSLQARWEGGGFLGNQTAAGSWSLLIKQGQWEQVKLELLEATGRHSSGAIEVAPFRLTTKNTKFSAEVDWKPGALRCTKIALEQWGHPVLNGEFILPLALDQHGLHWVEKSEISGQLRADRLDLHPLLSVNGAPSPLHGTVQLTLNLGGTPAAPTATLRCSASGLRPGGIPQSGSSSIALDGRYSQGTLSANATATTPLQSPILLSATLPIPLAPLFSGAVSFQDLPLQASIQAKNLNLSPLAGLLPGLRKTTGSATIDLKLKGTPRHPTWLGEFRVACPLLHFASDRLPAIGELTFAADFSEKEVRLHRLKADLGGGNLEIHGTASIATPGDPLLNFTAKAHEVLVVRNSKLALRLNGDLHLRGPWKHAEISGAVSPTKSRIERDIEVLPLNALRMEIPRETRTVGKPWFTFRKAPFSDWRFNVELRTTQNDRIQLRGNRLRGSADAEMRLEGTGATPTLHGAYRSTDVIATLPFARIELSRGRIWYTRDHPFQPHIDFSAETEVRNHRIRLYLDGPANAPHITASSEPPEPEPALLTLIATGALPGDSTERSQALANRAAAVLFQEFSDKVLPSGDRERFSALRRFNLDLGAINNRTGQQETRLTYRVMDDVFMIGELRPGGDFAARVRYLFRFR